MAAGRSYELVPRDVPPVDTRFRRIATKLPVPESVPILESLRRCEPQSMEGQPPVVWDHADGCQVYDKYGNMWLDFSSGVLVANAGHGRKEIADAVVAQAQHGLLTHYCFPGEPRMELAKRLVELAPPSLDKAFILTTGSEAVECTIKLSRAHGLAVGGPDKRVTVSFMGSFHGRTLAAQLAGGIPALKEWIGPLDPAFVQVPFPDGFRCENTSFDLFAQTLQEMAIRPEHVCGVLTETFQGGCASFLPVEYMKRLRAWCDEHDVVLTCDEVQAGFGRTGKLWGFEHYGIVPDLMPLGKGISSSLPISAVVGKASLLNQFPPGSMTSTHTGNPICAAAAVANIDLILKEKLIDHAATVGEILQGRLREIKDRFSNAIGWVDGKGMVAALQCVVPGTKDPDPDLAWDIVRRCVESGLLFFSPVGKGGGAVKVCPPLCTPVEAIREGCQVISESIASALAARAKA
ncbi:MAG: aspartate aminotransferase family protein [Phycisphaerae bacterium]|nr:aspartate aminotransferase family protein [Phycisphaerae bacterium]